MPMQTGENRAKQMLKGNQLVLCMGAFRRYLMDCRQAAHESARTIMSNPNLRHATQLMW